MILSLYMCVYICIGFEFTSVLGVILPLVIECLQSLLGVEVRDEMERIKTVDLAKGLKQVSFAGDDSTMILGIHAYVCVFLYYIGADDIRPWFDRCPQRYGPCPSRAGPHREPYASSTRQTGRTGT